MLRRPTSLAKPNSRSGELRWKKCSACDCRIWPWCISRRSANAAGGACAVNGGLPAQRNALDVGELLARVYVQRPGLAGGSRVPNDPELPLPLPRVLPMHEVVRIDHFLPGCPPGADAIWAFLGTLLDGGRPDLPPHLLRYD